MSATPNRGQTIRFDGRVAIVTGAGSGLGRDYALNLAARGARVVVNDLGTDTRGRIVNAGGESSAQAVVREIRSAGGEAVACHESCATRAGGKAIVETALSAFGRVDVLIHNAGFLRNAAFEALTDEQIDAVMNVHLMAGFYVGQPAFAAMKSQGYGRILLTSSASGAFGTPWQANYAAAKMGLAGLVNVIALEGAAHGITANGLLPTGSGRLGRNEDLDWPPEMAAMAPANMEAIAPAMRNEYVTPMVLWLVSERCRASHALYSATAGRYARVFIGAASGWLSDPVQPPQAEDIESHLARIDDTSTFDIPADVFDEFRPIIAAALAARN
ncbi:MAG: SDR family NAD(P)-dependent oxidoreductase [Gammaproteobacteria bacterium]